MEAMLNDIKTLLNIDIAENSKDGILALYIRKATTAIKKYINNDKFSIEYIQENFQDAIVEIVVNSYSIKGKAKIKQEQQGSRTTIYVDNADILITDSVKSLLPIPYVRMC